MAKDGFEDILTLAIVAGGGYLLWNWWTSQPASTPAAETPAAPTNPAAGAAYVPPTLTQQMQTAANGNSFYVSQGNMLNANQWSALWTQIGQPAIDPTTFDSIFFPQGQPPSGTAAPLMTLATFMAALHQGGIWNGLSGLGQAPRLIPVPIVLAGRKTSMSIPAGTTPAQLQAILRSRA